MVKYQFITLVERDEDGVYIVSCPALEGCYTQGKPYHEAIENIKRSIRLHIESLRAASLSPSRLQLMRLR